MKTIAVTNMKGGVGKTSVSVHLATGLAQNHRVLLIDTDPQGNATAWMLGLERIEEGMGTAEVLRGGKLEQKHISKVGTNLELLAATRALEGVEHTLAAEVGGQLVLKRALQRYNGEKWDYVIIDCGPTLGLTVLNGLCAAEWVIAPVLSAFLSLVGLRRLEETVELIRDRLNQKTRVLGYVLFAADPREAITQEARDILRKEAPGKLFKAEVRVSAAAKALPDQRRTAWDGGDERGAEDYAALMKETLRRLEAA
jgi:chromosome partitioning protein